MYAKIDLMLLCFLRSKKQRQCQNVFWQRVHFPLENVQHHIFQRKMLGLAPFFFALQKTLKRKIQKCSLAVQKYIFASQRSKMFSKKKKLKLELFYEKKQKWIKSLKF